MESRYETDSDCKSEIEEENIVKSEEREDQINKKKKEKYKKEQTNINFKYMQYMKYQFSILVKNEKMKRKL